MIAFAATLVPASMLGCSSDPETSSLTDSATDDGVDDVPSLDAAYGGPPDTAMPDTATTDSAPEAEADAATDAARD